MGSQVYRVFKSQPAVRQKSRVAGAGGRKPAHKSPRKNVKGRARHRDTNFPVTPTVTTILFLGAIT